VRCTMTNKAPLSDEEKRRRLRALEYERNMLRNTAMALASGIIENHLILNTFVESFLIHARLLIGFLYGPYNKDDLRPEDWLAPEEWSRMRGDKSDLLQETYNDAHKYLAHLTATRLNRKKIWKCPEILREIETLLDKFFKQLQEASSGEVKKD